MRKLKNIIENLGCLILLFVIFASIVITPSCKEEGGTDRIPVIHYLRVTDPALADSTFTDVSPGSMIVVVGENLDGVKKVYINNQEISFNANYGTSTSLIITVPSDDDFKLSGPNPDVPSELRIVTDHGVATFSMHVLSPGPVISNISAFYPIEPGDEISLKGENFYEIKRIYFTTDSINVTETITDYSVNSDYSEISFTVPDKLNEKGYIIMECYTSDACIEFVPEGPKAVITGISSTMPIVGSEVRILGKNLIDVSRININGEFDIFADEIKLSPEYDELSFTMPKAPSKSGKLSVTTISGTFEMEETFYPKENIILDWDNAGSWVWGGYSQLYNSADGTVPPYISDGNYSGIVGVISANNYWWGQTVNATVWPAADVIPENTKTSDLELQFECYVAEAFEGPVLQIQLGGNFNAALSNYVPVGSFTGETEIGRWMQCSIPLSSLVEENTWKDFLNIGHSTELGVYITNPTDNADVHVEIYFDNFRIVPAAKQKD